VRGREPGPAIIVCRLTSGRRVASLLAAAGRREIGELLVDHLEQIVECNDPDEISHDTSRDAEPPAHLLVRINTRDRCRPSVGPSADEPQQLEMRMTKHRVRAGVTHLADRAGGACYGALIGQARITARSRTVSVNNVVNKPH
jgi:hypothetical protein